MPICSSGKTLFVLKARQSKLAVWTAGLRLNAFRLIPLIHGAAELGRCSVKQCP